MCFLFDTKCDYYAAVGRKNEKIFQNGMCRKKFGNHYLGPYFEMIFVFVNALF